jgi:hypothetical protein
MPSFFILYAKRPGAIHSGAFIVLWFLQERTDNGKYNSRQQIGHPDLSAKEQINTHAEDQDIADEA